MLILSICFLVHVFLLYNFLRLVHVSPHLSIHPPLDDITTHPSTIHPPTHLSVHLFICPYIHSCIHPSITTPQSVHPPSPLPPVHLPTHPLGLPSAHLSRLSPSLITRLLVKCPALGWAPRPCCWGAHCPGGARQSHHSQVPMSLQPAASCRPQGGSGTGSPARGLEKRRCWR